jgi:hypothetical protein
MLLLPPEDTVLLLIVGAVAPLHITVEAEVMLPGVNTGRTINTYDPALCTKVVLHAPSFAQRLIVYLPGGGVNVPVWA